MKIRSWASASWRTCTRGQGPARRIVGLFGRTAIEFAKIRVLLRIEHLPGERDELLVSGDDPRSRRKSFAFGGHGRGQLRDPHATEREPPEQLDGRGVVALVLGHEVGVGSFAAVLLDLPAARSIAIHQHVLTEPRRVVEHGERRRVEIARAIATNPQFLLLDEPFTGIDPIAIQDIQKLIVLLKNRGLGVLLTDHNPQATLSVVDRANIIHDGKLIFSGTHDEVAANPLVRQTYLGEDFNLD